MGARVRVDWFRVVADLEGKGYKPNSIGAAINVPRRTIVGWRNYGSEPAHAEGERLIELWCQVLAGARSDIPRNIDDLLSVARASAAA